MNMRHVLCVFCVCLACVLMGCNLSEPDVEPPPAINVQWSPMTISFDPVKVGQTNTQTILLQNKGRRDITISTLKIVDAMGQPSDVFAVSNFDDALVADGSVTINVDWTPLDAQADSATLQLYADGSAPFLEIPLSSPEPLKELGDASLVVSPMTARFEQVPLNSAQSLMLTLSLGMAGQVLTIEQMYLIENEEDALPEFSFDLNSELPLELNGENRLEVQVNYTARNEIKDTGILRLKTSNAQQPIIDIPIEVASLDVSGILAPKVVSLKNQRPKQVAATTFEVKNNTDEDWPIDTANVLNDQSSVFDVSFSYEGDVSDKPPAVLKARSSVEVKVSATSSTQGVFVAQLALASSQEPQTLPIELRANFTESCLRFEGAQAASNGDVDYLFDFGIIPKGQKATTSFFLTNCSGSNAAKVQRLSIEGTHASVFETLMVSPNNTLDLEPLERVEIPISFTPGLTASQTAQLSIQTTDGNYVAPTVQLQGQGGFGECVPVVAQARSINTQEMGQTLEVVPLSTVQLSVTSSHEAQTRFEWVLRRAPVHALTRFVEVPNSSDMTLFLPLVGQYVVDVFAIDAEGRRSCAPATMTLDVTPQSSFYIQLHWHTPNDPEPLDENGADLDLHYSRDADGWNDTQYDIYWSNPTADWGEPGVADDPVLVREDDGGYGPEAISHGVPDQTFMETYYIGAYYFADNGLGRSFASVQIYVDKTLIFDAWSPSLSLNRFWRVGAINGQTRSFTPSNTVRTGFP